MKNNLESLLEEFLPPEMVTKIVERAKDLELSVKVRKSKGRWHRETLRKLVKERGEHCAYCNAGGESAKITLDHIVPKKMLLDMGLEEFYDDESNLEVLCYKCNSQKGSQLDFGNPKTIIQLEKYINLYKSRHKNYDDKSQGDQGPESGPKEQCQV